MQQLGTSPVAREPFIWPVRVYYEDTDGGGVGNGSAVCNSGTVFDGDPVCDTDIVSDDDTDA